MFSYEAVRGRLLKIGICNKSSYLSWDIFATSVRPKTNKQTNENVDRLEIPEK